MTRHLKPITAVLLCLTLALSLCGCSAGSLSTGFRGKTDIDLSADAPQPFEIDTIIPTAAPETETADEEIEAAAAVSEDSRADEDTRIQALLDSMTLEQKVAQMFFVSFDCLTGITDSNIAGDVTQQAMADFPIGGVVLFAGNIEDPDQLTALTEGLQTYSEEITGLPLLIGVDEEGGTVTRIASNSAFGLTDVGPMSSIGAAGDVQAAYDAGSYIGTYLSQYGLNMDFAPDADVLTDPENTETDTRSFGSDPQLVSSMAQQYYEGLAAQGVHGCLKYFPCHGNAAADTQEGMTCIDRTLDELTQYELVPFENAAEYDADAIMVAHISLPSVTGDDTPASLSSAIVTDLLRKQIGYEGIVVTDALNTGAAADYYTPAQAAVAAVQAGDDMLLFTGDALSAYQAVLDAVNNGTITEQRIDESVTRILRLKLSL